MLPPSQCSLAACMSSDPLLQSYRLKHLVLRNRVMTTAHESIKPTIFCMDALDVVNKVYPAISAAVARVLQLLQ